jgi:hypothetical protein
MEAVDVQLNSKDKGLTCDNGQSVTISASPTPRTARRYRCQGQIAGSVAILIDAIGDDQSHIERVLIAVAQTTTQSDAIAAEILGFFATLPYKDADPTRSRDWVKTNIGAPDAKLTVGQATLVLGKVDARNHTMEIRALGWVPAG